MVGLDLVLDLRELIEVELDRLRDGFAPVDDGGYRAEQALAANVCAIVGGARFDIHGLFCRKLYLKLGSILVKKILASARAELRAQLGWKDSNLRNGGTKNRCLTTWLHPTGLALKLGDVK